MKRILYYVLVIKPYDGTPPLPVAEMMTSDYSTGTHHYFIHYVLHQGLQKTSSKYNTDPCWSGLQLGNDQWGLPGFELIEAEWRIYASINLSSLV